MASSPRRRAAPRAAHVLLALLAFLAGHLASTAHDLATVHRVCAEHGELLDVHGALADAGAHEQAPAGPHLRESERHDEEHAHCLFAGVANERACAERAPPFAVRRSAVARPAPQPAPPRAPAFALHLLAPKHSPPA